MTNAIDAKSEVLMCASSMRCLAALCGSLSCRQSANIKGGGTDGDGGGQNDPAQMFQQIMQQLTQQG